MKTHSFPARIRARLGEFLALSGCLTALQLSAAADHQPLPSTWPQAYQVQQSKPAGTLTLSTPYYVIEHDLKKGGAISLIRLTYGKQTNLLLRPLETRLVDRQGAVFTDLRDPEPKLKLARDGLTEIVTLESKLYDEQGREGGLLRTSFEYHWGYVKIRKEFIPRGAPFRAKELCVLSTTLAPSLTAYGYRDGLTEQEKAPEFSFGSCHWGTVRSDRASEPGLKLPHLPRYLMLADPGVEGLEWFEGSDLFQWDLQLSGRRGQGDCTLQPTNNPAGLALSISPFKGTEATPLAVSCVFNYYLGIPILEGHARRPWFHTSFNRNKGDWVSTDQVRKWAQSGIQTVHCHNDGDYFEDGLFWRDGSYPPYPDMDKYDKVITDAHHAGIRVATYFSNKELHPSTKEFQQNGSAWGRKNLKGKLQHNFFRGTNEFGAQMCLRSDWSSFLRFSIDRVLTQHPLDGVYYDWNVALLCNNQAHGDKGDPNLSAHWDIDELLQLMEWTRRRVGPNGLVILHNTTTPMFCTENFADDIVANEWGYGKWTGPGPELKDLPLEWSLVGARSRGVISYGQLDDKSPRRLHRVFALQALLGGVTPWPASPETFELFPVLKSIGDIESYRFRDWRNDAVLLHGSRCGAAIYSRPGEACLLLANFDEKPQEFQCVLRPEKLPFPIASPTAVENLTDPKRVIDIKRLIGDGVPLNLPPAAQCC